MSAPERVAIGAVFGRWKVLAYVASAQRAGEPFKRARVRCRCVCRREQLVFETDLKRGHTAGCNSKRCFFKWEASQEMAERVTRALALDGRVDA